ncbi:MAG: TIGR04551 family protein [Polyangiaceae bacterium]|nr:TIGR04551 family protein [Polyangiaceae bacterium]
MPSPMEARSPTAEGEGKGKPSREKADAPDVDVFAEDWWSHARPILEIHGYFRTRVEMFHRFSLGRIDQPGDQLWPVPVDHRYTAFNSGDSQPSATYGPVLCTDKESPSGSTDSRDPEDGLYRCKNHTQMGANIRFRLNPELHISDNLRVVSQIDLLDNLVLGTTPEGYAITPDADGGYASVQRGGYNPISLFDVSQTTPTSGVNGTKDSIRVKRVWAEFQTPVGELRFGRMPSHWGLGMVENSGDGYDDDYQTTIDRLMFVTGVKPLGLYVSGAWDFANEGATTENLLDSQGQAQDAAQKDDVRQLTFSIARRTDPDLAKQALAKNRIVVNGGAQLVWRRQRLANDLAGDVNDGANVPGAYPEGLMPGDVASGYVRRGGMLLIPDLWVQLLYKTFRFEAEGATVQGHADNVETATGTTEADFEDWKFRAWGFAAEAELHALEERLQVDFKGGWASGDPEASEADRPGSGGLTPGYGDGLQDQLGDDTYSTFAFHPNCKIDLILNRNILSRVQGSYYLRPGVAYDFMRSPDGQRLGGGFAAIWTRASSFVQTPGHKRDLGIELNGRLFFQSKDGALNDLPGSLGGFYTQLEYGVLFPLRGLGYQKRELASMQAALGDEAGHLKAAQILRWYLGVLF